jgi:G:T/U-mismatch repair DNA glycosylase
MQQYYAQPRNAFWPIMGRLLCFEPAVSYHRRVAAFFASCKNIATVCFNGGKAAALYGSLVMPRLPPDLRHLEYVALPSTSPAHAAMPFPEKLRRWSNMRRASET